MSSGYGQSNESNMPFSLSQQNRNAQNDPYYYGSAADNRKAGLQRQGTLTHGGKSFGESGDIHQNATSMSGGGQAGLMMDPMMGGQKVPSWQQSGGPPLNGMMGEPLGSSKSCYNRNAPSVS